MSNLLDIPEHKSPWGYKITRAEVLDSSVRLTIKKKKEICTRVHFIDYDGSVVTTNGHTDHDNGSLSWSGVRDYKGYKLHMLPKMFAIAPAVFSELFELVQA
jgi:hypothetical protein